MSDSSWNTSTWDNPQRTSSEEVKTCPNCNRRIPQSADFCPFCGFSFEVSSLSEPKDTQQVSYAPEIQQKKQLSISSIFAVVFVTLAAMFVGFLFITSLMTGKSADSTSKDTMQTNDGQTAYEEAQTAAATENKADRNAEVTAETTVIPTATQIPTATPTPIPTATPTEVPLQTINQPNIIDASTGQLIFVPNDTAESFAYPDSGNHLWSYGDVSGMTAGQVRYCINEIYAKHGYIFQNENWFNYFMQKTWYSPTIPKASFGDQYLNANEVANVKLLNQYYNDRKFPDY